LVTWSTLACKASVMFDCLGIIGDTGSTVLTRLGGQTTVGVFETAVLNTRSNLGIIEHCHEKDVSYRPS
jgi:hypothetical protein